MSVRSHEMILLCEFINLYCCIAVLMTVGANVSGPGGCVAVSNPSLLFELCIELLAAISHLTVYFRIMIIDFFDI